MKPRAYFGSYPDQWSEDELVRNVRTLLSEGRDDEIVELVLDMQGMLTEVPDLPPVARREVLAMMRRIKQRHGVVS